MLCARGSVGDRSLRPDLGFREFVVWLIVDYLVALALETWMVLSSSKVQLKRLVELEFNSVAAVMDPFHHVRDGSTWELPKFVLDLLGRKDHVVLPFGLTKYMVLQVVAAVTVFLIFRGLAKRIAGGKPGGAFWWNFWEMLALYVRDEVVRPSIGIPHHGTMDHGHGHEDDDGHASHEHRIIMKRLGSPWATGSPAVAVEVVGSSRGSLSAVCLERFLLRALLQFAWGDTAVGVSDRGYQCHRRSGAS